MLELQIGGIFGWKDLAHKRKWEDEEEDGTDDCLVDDGPYESDSENRKKYAKRSP